MRRVLTAVVACAAGWSFAPPAHANIVDVEDLDRLSIEELAQIPVRSASKREEPLSEAPAALFVITGESIVSSGVTSLPEALRLAPNLWVQQIDSSQYTITARGFNGLQSGNKLLALIDGRSIYTPLASSVFWNLNAPLLEDIQQIEVISGPGGTLYGPNAVNGVVSVMTRDAQDTIGSLVRASAGGNERTAAIRHGFALGGNGAIRLYANWLDREGLPAGIAPDVDDDYRGWQAGFRSDFVSASDHVTVQGDLFHNRSEVASGDNNKGHNLLARWERTLSPNASFQLQAYYDWFKREFTLVEDSLETMDAEAQFNFSSGAHELVAGAGVRTTRDEFINDLNIFKLDPESRRLWVYNLFVQDRFSLADALALTLGVKVERSSFTGWQVLPNARLAWQPNANSLLWAAVSRAVRTPSRIDQELQAPPLLAKSLDFDSEKLIAVEAGYRGALSPLVSVSVSGFVNFYDDIRTTEFTGDPFPIKLLNNLKGETYGVEAWGNAQVAPWWRLSLGAATLVKKFREKGGAVNLNKRNSLGNDPGWQIRGRSEFDLSPRLHLSLNGRIVGRIEQDPEVDSYVEAGANLAYQLTEQVELYVAGRNLLHRSHLENNDSGAGQSAERSIYAGTRLRF